MAENPPGTSSASEAEQPVAAPVSTPMPPPPSYAPSLPPAAWGTAAPATQARGGRWIAITLIVVFAVSLVGGAGAFAANSYLSDKYSPQRAVLSYFVAQQHGDVNAMLANANFVRGDGSYEQFFDRVGVKAMMEIPQNKEVSDVKILSTKGVTSNNDQVDVSMTWAGAQHIYNYTVRKDAAKTNYLFYSSWRGALPYSTPTPRPPNHPPAADGA